jgi:hypothetical protein
MLENTKTILQISTVEKRQKKNEMFDTDINFNLSSLLGFCVVQIDSLENMNKVKILQFILICSALRHVNQFI